MTLRVSVALALAAMLACSRRPELPELPTVDTSAFQPTVRDAVRKASDAARAAPTDAAVVGRFCMTLHAHQLNAPAAACYRRVRALAPREGRWAYLLGAVETRAGAVETLRAATALDPNYLPAHLLLGDALLEAGRAGEARSVFLWALRLDPNQPATHFSLGRAAVAENDWSAALEHFQRAVSLSPSFGQAHYALGQALAKMGDAESSKKHLALATTHSGMLPPITDPILESVREFHAGAYNFVAEGVQLAAAGRHEEAARRFEEALKADPRDAAAHQNLIVTYGRLQRIADAERHYRQAVKLNPSAAEAHFNYGVLMARTGRADLAREAFGKALAAEPNNAEAQVNLGVLDEAAEQSAEASKHFRAAIMSEPSHEGANFRLGRLLLAGRRTAAALAHLEVAAKARGPLEAQALYGIAVAHKMRGDQRNARAAAQAALAKAASQPDLAAAIRREFP